MAKVAKKTWPWPGLPGFTGPHFPGKPDQKPGKPGRNFDRAPDAKGSFSHISLFMSCTFFLPTFHVGNFCFLSNRDTFAIEFKDGASFCYCAYFLRILGYVGFSRNLPTNTTIFCTAYDFVEKADLSKGYQNPKRKLGVTVRFSEIIELKFGKKLPYILCILTLF